MAYCFMSTEKIKSLGAFTRKYEHNYRTGTVHNADKSRTHLNEELIKLPEGQNYTDAFRRKMLEINHTPRKNAVLGIEIVMTYNSMKVDNNFDIDKWKDANIKWLKENFPEEGIISAVMHRDEGPDNGKSAHIHAIVVPIHDGKLNCKHFLSGRAKLIKLQDSYGKAMKPFGLERGKEGSVGKHEEMRRFYDTLHKAVSVELPEPEEDEELDDYFQRVNNIYKDSSTKHLAEIKQKEREIVELKTDLKNARIEMRTEIKNLEKDKKLVEEEKKKIAEKEKELAKKEEEQRELQTRLRNFNTLMNGLKNHPEKGFTEQLATDINNIIEWEKHYEEELNKNSEDREDLTNELFGQ